MLANCLEEERRRFEGIYQCYIVAIFLQTNIFSVVDSNRKKIMLRNFCHVRAGLMNRKFFFEKRFLNCICKIFAPQKFTVQYTT